MSASGSATASRHTLIDRYISSKASDSAGRAKVFKEILTLSWGPADFLDRDETQSPLLNKLAQATDIGDSDELLAALLNRVAASTTPSAYQTAILKAPSLDQQGSLITLIANSTRQQNVAEALVKIDREVLNTIFLETTGPHLMRQILTLYHVQALSSLLKSRIFSDALTRSLGQEDAVGCLRKNMQIQTYPNIGQPLIERCKRSYPKQPPAEEPAGDSTATSPPALQQVAGLINRGELDAARVALTELQQRTAPKPGQSSFLRGFLQGIETLVMYISRSSPGTHDQAHLDVVSSAEFEAALAALTEKRHLDATQPSPPPTFAVLLFDMRNASPIKQRTASMTSSSIPCPTGSLDG